jgi:hypothetical protein
MPLRSPRTHGDVKTGSWAQKPDLVKSFLLNAFGPVFVFLFVEGRRKGSVLENVDGRSLSAVAGAPCFPGARAAASRLIDCRNCHDLERVFPAKEGIKPGTTAEERGGEELNQRERERERDRTIGGY